MDLSQGLLVTHSAMPEGFLEEVGLWSWALGLLGLGKTQGCLGQSKRQEACVEGPRNIQTPTHSSTEGCHGNLTQGQASSASPPPAAGSSPITHPPLPHARAPEDRAWAVSPGPGTPLHPPLDLKLMWGSGKPRGRCGTRGRPT